MTDQHPITPPPELAAIWVAEIYGNGDPAIPLHPITLRLVERAAQWGADQELEACCEWLREAKNHGLGYELGAELARKFRAARRPKPPGLKEQALALLDPSNTYGSITQEEEYRISVANADTIRRALEALPND